MRILHLIDGRFRSADPLRDGDADAFFRDCRVLQAGAGHHQRVVVVGPRASVRRAETCGLRVHSALAPVLGRPAAAWRSMQIACAAEGRPDVVHCWGADALRLATRVFGDSVPRVAVLPQGEPSYACERILTYSEPARTRLMAGGVQAASVVVVPAPATPPHPGLDRAALRDSLGCGPGFVVALLGEPPQADVHRFAFLIGLLERAAFSVTGLASPRHGQRVRAQAFSKVVHNRQVVVTDVPLQALLPACDAAVFDGGGPGPTTLWNPSPWAAPAPIALAHAAGVPVVAPVWADVGDVYPRSAADTCLAPNSSLPELARRLFRLAEDDQLLATTSRAVRAHVHAQDRNAGYVLAAQECWNLLALPAEVMA
jgi:hypothetical protein